MTHRLPNPPKTLTHAAWVLLGSFPPVFSGIFNKISSVLRRQRESRVASASQWVRQKPHEHGKRNTPERLAEINTVCVCTLFMAGEGLMWLRSVFRAGLTALQSQPDGSSLYIKSERPHYSRSKLKANKV